MTGPTLLRIGAFIFVALALAAAAMEAGRPAAESLQAAPTNPNAGALRKCRTLGMTAATDATCLRSWAEERERFLKVYPRADRFELPPEDAR